MIYIICVIKHITGGATYYRGFETCTESTLVMTSTKLIHILKNTKIQIVNASLQGDNVVLKKWANSITIEEKRNIGSRAETEKFGSDYILIKKENDYYKVVDYLGNVYKIWIEDLKEYVESGNVANCSISSRSNRVSCQDTYRIKKDLNFERLIASKYDGFVAKTLMLSCGNMTFNYAIENDVVQLTKYTGSSREVIVPPFVTAIGKDAFKGKGVNSVKFSNGLKIIGEMAFHPGGKSSGLDQIEIPETVELIANNAFMGNHIMDRADGTLNMKRFKLLGDKTIILQ